MVGFRSHGDVFLIATDRFVYRVRVATFVQGGNYAVRVFSNLTVNRRALVTRARRGWGNVCGAASVGSPCLKVVVAREFAGQLIVS